jgi:hypothetical protein
VRRATFMLLLVVALALELQHFRDGRSHPYSTPVPAEPVAQVRAEHLLTMLDFWNQELMPYILLQRSQARALQSGDVATAARLERRLVPGLMRVQRLWADAVREPLLREHGSVEGRALTAARVAWAEWAAAILRRRPPPAARLASLEANAVRLDQAAYAAVDASLKAALKQG